jgi:hypothetical protein
MKKILVLSDSQTSTGKKSLTFSCSLIVWTAKLHPKNFRESPTWDVQVKLFAYFLE